MIEIDIYFDIVRKAQNLEVLEQKVNKLDDATLKEPLETMVFLLKAEVAKFIEAKNAKIMKESLVWVSSCEQFNDTSTSKERDNHYDNPDDYKIPF